MSGTRSAGRSSAGRVLEHPLLWSPLLLAASVPLLGTEHDFWGFLLALLGGWCAGVAIVGFVRLVRPVALSVVVHVALGAALGLLLFAVAEASDALPLPPQLLVTVGFAAAPAAGWVWLSLVGRITGSVQQDAARRATELLAPQWRRDERGWSVELRVVPMRRAAFLGAIVAVSVAAAVVLGGFIILFGDLAQRMSPMVMLFVLGWTLGLPAYLVLRAVARARTEAVELRIDDERMRVLRRSDGRILADAPLVELRRLTWAATSSPTRIELHREAGGLVLLVGMARRPKGESPALPPLPPALTRMLGSAGLPPRRTRGGRASGDVVLARD